MAAQMKTTGVIGLLAGVAFATSASAAFDTTDPFEGTDVTYTDVIASPDLYGDPELRPDNLLVLLPATRPFQAKSPSAESQNVDGALSFNLSSNNGEFLKELTVNEGGDFSFLSNTPNSLLVSATLLVQILDVTTNLEIDSFQVVFSSTNDTVPTDSGFWSNSIVIDLEPYERSSIDVVLNNTLQAVGPQDGAATIRKKVFNIDTTVVPEPGTVAVLAGGLALLTLRRKSA